MKGNNKADLGQLHEPGNQLIKWVVAYAMTKGTGTITVHEQFAKALKKRHEEGIKQYVCCQVASSPIDLECRMLSFTSAGDLSPYITGYFNPLGAFPLIRK